MKRLSLILSITSILGFYGVSPGLAQDFIPQDFIPQDFIPKTYSLGGFPRATSLTDIDNDGDLDIALTNPNNHNIAILLNRGDGTFEMGNDYPPTIPIDGYPIAIISKDIDGDSDIDLVVLDSSGGIRTLFNEGELKFSQGGRYPSESYSFSISPSDVDLDGDWDIIVSSAKRTTVLLNDGTGRFNTNLIHPGGTNSHTYITTDLNLDDRDDIVIGDREGISVLLNNGDDTFARGVEYLTGKMPIAVVAGDIDSDLYPDLIVANYKSHTISILKNNRDGTFQEAVNYPSGKGPNSIALGDVDKDEDMDVVVTNGLSGDLSIFINNTVKPLSVATDSLPQGRRGLYYSARLEAKGGVPPYKWAVVSGSLPPTLYLDPLTGEMVSISHRGLPSEQISGRVEGGETQHEGHEDMGEPLKSFEPPCYCLKAPRGLYRFTVQVTDSTSSAATADRDIEVLPQPGTISGKIKYSGEKNGTIRIGIWAEFQTRPLNLFINPMYSTTVSAPAEYKIDNVYPESYIAGAYLDVNGNRIKDRDEPYGTFGPNGSEGKPGDIVVDDGAELSGIDIELKE